ncbi:hypothetical protein P8Q88_12950 [Qipengyuania sp. XHP0207]|uniref:hypothetical protein n=1 Tax=Qipengyuania sp. XHP0207 TaxID=3038078 RepID=UPI00241EE65B|nr:hypothetical protein [Qipengyuania sp. XHP0207]MDG5749085.1 hypothetical protein [Qipengyuania sp. XHP0207]
MNFKPVLAGASALALIACGETADTSEPEAPAEDVAVIPETLAPFGDGYPASGDPCRRLGESAATSNYLDDSAILVGCPTEASAEALGGEIVDNVDGVRLVSVSMGDANVGMSENGPAASESEDALVAGTEYNATTILDCGFDGQPPTQSCNAGIKRNWGETPGEHLVEVTKPDGRTRAIFFRGTEPYGADSAQADGSAGWDFETSRDGDRVTVKYGPETYVLVDAMITGG